MKIKEVIERECCQEKDLKPYYGTCSEIIRKKEPKFCVHCGQMYILTEDHIDEFKNRSIKYVKYLFSLGDVYEI